MKIKSEKGITGIDITIAILIITLFVALITTLFYRLNANSAEMERRSEATHKAINIIENVKNEIKYNEKYRNTLNGIVDEGYIDNGPYYKKVSIIDYSAMPENENKEIIPNVIKKITVEVLYKDGKENESVSLSAIVNMKE